VILLTYVLTGWLASALVPDFSWRILWLIGAPTGLLKTSSGGYHQGHPGPPSAGEGEHTGLDLYAYPDAAKARDAAKAVGVATEQGVSWGQVVEAVFGAKVEGRLSTRLLRCSPMLTSPSFVPLVALGET
jgi:hypothetical protein